MRTRRRVHRPADGPVDAPRDAIRLSGAAGNSSGADPRSASDASPSDERAPDDADLGWGERPGSSRTGENDARLLEDRPPHHDGRSSS